MSKPTKAQRQERDEAITTLREWIKPGDEILVTVTHVVRSGMQRSIRMFRTYVEDNKANIHEISWLAARAMDYRLDDKNGGIKVGGCGMDMGFHLVYSLGRTLFPDGGSLDVTNPVRKRQAEHAGETSEKDGGYLLKHKWL